LLPDWPVSRQQIKAAKKYWPDWPEKIEMKASGTKSKTFCPRYIKFIE